MFSKLSLSLAAAVALSTAAGGVALAAPVLTGPDEGRASARSSTHAGLGDAGPGHPENRDDGAPIIGSHSPTNDEINAAETGNPESIDNKDQQGLTTDGNSQTDWQRLESGSPDKP